MSCCALMSGDEAGTCVSHGRLAEHPTVFCNRKLNETIRLKNSLRKISPALSFECISFYAAVYVCSILWRSVLSSRAHIFFSMYQSYEIIGSRYSRPHIQSVDKSPFIRRQVLLSTLCYVEARQTCSALSG